MGHHLPVDNNYNQMLIEHDFSHADELFVQLFDNGPTYCCDFFHNVTLMLEEYDPAVVAYAAAASGSRSPTLVLVSREQTKLVRLQQWQLYCAVFAFMKSQMTAFEIANLWTYGPMRVLSARRQLENCQSKFSLFIPLQL